MVPNLVVGEAQKQGSCEVFYKVTFEGSPSHGSCSFVGKVQNVCSELIEVSARLRLCSGRMRAGIQHCNALCAWCAQTLRCFVSPGGEAQTLRGRPLEELFHEAMVHRLVTRARCQYIVPFVGVGGAAVESGGPVLPFIVTGMGWGSLRKLLEEKSRELTIGHVHQVAEALFGALTQVHACGVVHLDIRPGNVLVMGDTELAPPLQFRVGGFRLARQAQQLLMLYAGQRDSELHLVPEYRAPEFMLSSKADVFSAALCLAEVVIVGLLGRDHMPSGNRQTLLEAASDMLEKVPCSHLAELLRRCGQVDPTHRPTAADAFKLVWESSHLKSGKGALLAAFLEALLVRVCEEEQA